MQTDVLARLNQVSTNKPISSNLVHPIAQLPMPLSINKNPQEALIKSIEGKPSSPLLCDHLGTAVSHAREAPILQLESYRNSINEDLSRKVRHPEAPPASGHSCSSNLYNTELEGTHAGVPFLVKPKPKSCQRWFLRMLTKVINSKCPSPSFPPFKFCLSKDAARFNHELLKSFNGDVDAIIRSHPLSPMSYGSEFKDTSVLQDFIQIPSRLDEDENNLD